jgi:hypothetical protein
MAAASSSAAAARFSWEKKTRGRRWPKRKGFSGPVGLYKGPDGPISHSLTFVPRKPSTRATMWPMIQRPIRWPLDYPKPQREP